MSNGRFYVRKNGVEVANHPLNGAVYAGCDRYIGYVNGYPVREALYIMRGKENVMVYAKDMQDTPVMVNKWFPGGVEEMFVFATREQIEKAGKKFTPA